MWFIKTLSKMTYKNIQNEIISIDEDKPCILKCKKGQKRGNKRLVYLVLFVMQYYTNFYICNAKK